MAKITLPTNYRDDILNPSAEGKRKYVMTYNQDGTVSFEDVTPYEQVGSDYGAGDINTTNEAVNESFDKNKLIKDLDTINALTEEGYAPDALAFRELTDSLGSLIITRVVTQEVTLANGAVIDNVCPPPVIEGYTLLGVKGYNLQSTAFVTRWINVNGISFRNVGSSSDTKTIAVTYNYIKNKYLN